MLLQYCHYVAGLASIGLSRLFSASGLEGEEVGKDERLANSSLCRYMAVLFLRPLYQWILLCVAKLATHSSSPSRLV